MDKLIAKKKWMYLLFLVIFTLKCSVESPEEENRSESNKTPYIIYKANNKFYLIKAKKGSSPINLNESLDQLSSLTAGSNDEWINISKNKQWFILSTERFGMTGWAGLALVKTDFSEGYAVKKTNSDVFHGGFSVISSDGNLIIYSEADNGITHLYAITRNGNYWNNPICLTTASSYQYNSQPSLSYDETQIVFDCGDTPYGQEGTSICMVNTDGSGFEVVLTPTDYPDGTVSNALHHPSFASDGSIVFEADWNGEQIWRYSKGSGLPQKINNAFNNDNSPVVLADGRIASLWLGRSGGIGYHELKVMDADGNNDFMLIMDTDIDDIGMGSGF